MLPLYEENKENMVFLNKKSEHIAPHLHKAMEIVLVTQGTLELGIGEDLFHMDRGDLAIVFPDLIHHYQVFSAGRNEGYYVLALPVLTEKYAEILQQCYPVEPVIKAPKVHKDILYALESLKELEGDNHEIAQAYINIIVARCLECYELVERGKIENDIVTRTVSYISENFQDNLTLSNMAKDLGVSKFVLSRVFSGVFHTNFNRYVNEVRLNYVAALLEYTQDGITQICMNSGFESQRTFNRVFQSRYKMSPREYRNRCRKGNGPS